MALNYEQMYSELMLSLCTREPEGKSQLDLYKKAVNRIDDYFEYRNESKADREMVYKILDDLTKNLKELK